MPELGGAVENLRDRVAEELGHFQADTTSVEQTDRSVGEMRSTAYDIHGHLNAAIEAASKLLQALAQEKENGEQILNSISQHAESVSQVLTDAERILEGSHNEHAANAKESLGRAQDEAHTTNSTYIRIHHEVSTTTQLAGGLTEALGAAARVLAMVVEKHDEIVSLTEAAKESVATTASQTGNAHQELAAYRDA